MNELSLFSGAGGGLLGTKLLGWNCVGYVEKDDYCQRVIAQRINDGNLDNAPVFGDIGTFINEGYASAYKGMVDVITAGFPCQPFSVAGKRKGEMDERNMWPATIETIRIVRPRFCLLENVPGLLAHEYFGTILRELSESGYDARWKVISAAEMGAPHKRDRLWIAAVSNAERCDGRADDEGKTPAERGGASKMGNPRRTNGAARPGDGLGNRERQNRTPSCSGGSLSDAIDPRLEKREGLRKDDEQKFQATQRGNNITWWDTDPADIPNTDQFNDDRGRHGTGEIRGKRPEQGGISKSQQNVPDTDPRSDRQISQSDIGAIQGRNEKSGHIKTGPTQPQLGRVAHGVANRVDRLKAIGNGQVPAVVRAAWELLTL